MAKRPELAGSVTFVALEDMPVGELHPHPENPNRGDLSAIKRSLKKHGQYRTIVAHRDGTILAGHHVWMAATELGWPTVRVERVECSVDAARSVLLADNRLAELGPGVHPESLLQLLQSIESLDGTGYSDEDLAALENDIEPPTPNGDPDDAPPLPKKSRAKAGEIWLLGKHRLAVGDSTNEALMDRLFTDWDRPAGIITDPPYGVDYVGGTKDKLRVANDKLQNEALQDLIYRALANAGRHLDKGSPWYVFGPSNEQQLAYRLALHELGWQVRAECVWVKNALVMGRGDYQMKHESLLTGGDDADPESWAPAMPEGHDVALYGWKPGASHRWLGDRKQTTVWEHPRPTASADHPTMKPVELIASIIRNSIPPGEVVIDVFAGSGTIMAAAFLTGRRAAMIELDPRYAEVIISRWETLSGGTAERMELR